MTITSGYRKLSWRYLILLALFLIFSFYPITLLSHEDISFVTYLVIMLSIPIFIFILIFLLHYLSEMFVKNREVQASKIRKMIQENGYHYVSVSPNILGSVFIISPILFQKIIKYTKTVGDTTIKIQHNLPGGLFLLSCQNPTKVRFRLNIAQLSNKNNLIDLLGVSTLKFINGISSIEVGNQIILRTITNPDSIPTQLSSMESALLSLRIHLLKKNLSQRPYQ